MAHCLLRQKTGDEADPESLHRFFQNVTTGDDDLRALRSQPTESAPAREVRYRLELA